MHRRRQERQDLEYLLKHIDKVPKLLRAAHANSPIAGAIDLLHNQLNLVNNGTFLLMMGQLAKQEQLRVKTQYTEVYLQGGQPRQRVVEDFTLYAPAKWLRLFSDQYKPIKQQLDGLWQKLKMLPSSSAGIEAVNPQERKVVAMKLRKAHAALTDLTDELRLCQSVLEGEAPATLRTWGARADAELPIFYDVQANLTLSVGLRSFGKPKQIKFNYHALDTITAVRALDKM